MGPFRQKLEIENRKKNQKEKRLGEPRIGERARGAKSSRRGVWPEEPKQGM
jgi:hypothetical protein